MRKVWILPLAFCFLTVACGGNEAVDSDSAGAEPVDVAAEPAPTEPVAEPTDAPTDTAVPEPTATTSPTATPAPALVTTADDMVGIWMGTLAGERGYVMYTTDGRFFVALTEDKLVTAPRVTGEYWFEDNQIHLRDLENAGHWTECSADIEGVYEVLDLDDGAIQFQTVDDACSEGGFTRNYLFANLKQEWLSEPVAVAEDPLP